VPRCRSRRLLHRRVTAKPPPQPQRLPRRSLPRPSLPLHPLAPPAPRCKSCPWPRAPSPTVLRVRDPRRPCVGRGGAALSLGRSALRCPPCAAPLPPCSRTTPTWTTRKATELVATLEARGSTRMKMPRQRLRQLQRPPTMTAPRSGGATLGATLAAEAPLPTPTEPRATTELQRRRPGPPRRATAPTVRRPSCRGPPAPTPAPAPPAPPRLLPGSAAAPAVPTRSSVTP
jgi:hypothetical protein